jgi:hypothetical protein
MNLRTKYRFYGTVLSFGLLFVSGCSSASKEDEAIRANNCALIADWNVYINDPSNPLDKLDTYEEESVMEDRLWLKIQAGDKSYDALMQLRELNYSQNLWNAPPIGEKVTQENWESFRVEGYEGNFDDEASWKIIDNVRISCPTFPKEYLAEMFAAAILL